MAYSAGDLGGVALDLHPAAAAVAELAPRHVGVDALAVELEPGGQPFDDAGEAGSMGLPGRGEAQRHARKLRGLLKTDGASGAVVNRAERATDPKAIPRY